MSGKTSHVDVLEHNIIMMAELPKQVYRFSAVLIKIQDWLFFFFPPQNWQADPEIHVKMHGT